MRFVLCIVIAALLPASALAATGGGSMSLSQTQAAAAKGDQKAAAAVQTTTSRESCMSGCDARGYSKNKCVESLPSGPVPPGRRISRTACRSRGARRQVMSELIYPNETKEYRDARDGCSKTRRSLSTRRRRWPRGAARCLTAAG